MRGLISEGKETMEEDYSDALMDSAIICAAQKVEHYEIAGYGTLVAWAQALGLDDVAELLAATLSEEKEADEKLAQIGTEVFGQVEERDPGSDEDDLGAESDEEDSKAVRGRTRAPAKANGRSRRRAS
jgi:ferritin-like metal-binding protein YciE